MSVNERHVAVIDPGSRVAELDAFNRLMELSHSRFSYHLPAMFGMESLHDLSNKPDAIIIFGSGASVYDDLPWQSPFNQWLETMLCADVPTLGLCYGHQLLAHLCGGKVGFVHHDQRKLSGARTVTITSDGFWGQTGRPYRWIVSHRECVVQLPSDFINIASSDEVKCEAFAHRQRPIWGVQAHPEAGPGFVRNQEIKLEESADPVLNDGRDFMRKFLQRIVR
ncbi:MAG: type 1 glutamine amidotransferase [Oligoflexus sp.]